MTRKLCGIVVLNIIIVFMACAPKAPPVVLPNWEPLPAVKWTVIDNKVCTEDYDNLKKREQLRDLRETTYLEMLKAMGAIEAPIKEKIKIVTPPSH